MLILTNKQKGDAMQKYAAEFFGTFWLFWAAPIAGALLGAVVYRFIGSGTE